MARVATRPRPTPRRNPSKREILADVRRRVGLQRTDLSAERYESVVDDALTDLYTAMVQQGRQLLQGLVDGIVHDVPAVEYLTAAEQRTLETWCLSSLRDLALYEPEPMRVAFTTRYAQLLAAFEPKLRSVFTRPAIAQRVLDFYRTTLQWYGQFVGANLRALAENVQGFPAITQAKLTREALGQDYLRRILDLLPTEVA